MAQAAAQNARPNVHVWMRAAQGSCARVSWMKPSWRQLLGCAQLTPRSYSQSKRHPSRGLKVVAGVILVAPYGGQHTTCGILGS